MQLLEEGVLQGLLGTDSFGGIIAKKSAHQVESVLLNAWEELFEGDTLSFLNAVVQESAHTLILDLVHQVLREGAQQSHESLHLLAQIFFSK